MFNDLALNSELPTTLLGFSPSNSIAHAEPDVYSSNRSQADKSLTLGTASELVIFRYNFSTSSAFPRTVTKLLP